MNQLPATSEQPRTDYYPFGLEMDGLTQRSNDPDDRYLYSGKELDREHSLRWYYFGVRYYHPALGRWLAVDPLWEKYPGWNPYNYTANDPINKSDPDGRFVIPIAIAAYAAIDIAATAVLTYIAVNSITSSPENSAEHPQIDISQPNTTEVNSEMGEESKTVEMGMKGEGNAKFHGNVAKTKTKEKARYTNQLNRNRQWPKLPNTDTGVNPVVLKTPKTMTKGGIIINGLLSLFSICQDHAKQLKKTKQTVEQSNEQHQSQRINNKKKDKDKEERQAINQR